MHFCCSSIANHLLLSPLLLTIAIDWVLDVANYSGCAAVMLLNLCRCPFVNFHQCLRRNWLLCKCSPKVNKLFRYKTSLWEQYICAFFTLSYPHFLKTALTIALDYYCAKYFLELHWTIFNFFELFCSALLCHPSFWIAPPSFSFLSSTPQWALQPGKSKFARGRKIRFRPFSVQQAKQARKTHLPTKSPWNTKDIIAWVVRHHNWGRLKSNFQMLSIQFFLGGKRRLLHQRICQV